MEILVHYIVYNQSTPFRSTGQLRRRIPYLAPLSPRPWSQTMVALCVPLGLTTCVLPYSNGLFAPATNAYSFIYYTQSHINPQRRKTETATNHQWNQSVPDARELLPPKLIPRTIAAPPHPSSLQGPPTLQSQQQRRQLSSRPAASGSR